MKLRKLPFDSPKGIHSQVLCCVLSWCFVLLHCGTVNKGVFIEVCCFGHQVAMLLHKLRPQKNPYYFWAVMSIVMQA